MKNKIMSLCCFLLAILVNQSVFAVPIIILSSNCINSSAPSITVTVSNYPAGTNCNVLFYTGNNFLSIGTGSFTTNAAKSFVLPAITSPAIGTGTYMLFIPGLDSGSFTASFAPLTITIGSVPSCLHIQPNQRVSLGASQSLCSTCSYVWSASGLPAGTFSEQINNSITFRPHINTDYTITAEYIISSGCTVTSSPLALNRCSGRPEFIDSVFDNPITIFPNPNHGTFTIDIKKVTNKASVNLYDFNGRLIRTVNLVQGTNTINATDLSSGEYNLVISIDGQSYPKKIIITK